MSIERSKLRNVEIAYIESTLSGIQRLRNDLVTQIAHEFRSPLTSVIGFAEMLVDDRPLSEEQRIEYARFIQYEGIRLSKLIDDLIELSFLERGPNKLALRDQDLQETIVAAIARISEFAHGRLVTVLAKLPTEPIVARFDREKIAKAMHQLLHNAVRYTKPRGEVIVSATAARGFVEISVQDAGPGIPEEHIPTLFEKFVDAVPQEQKSQGSGVGLVIVKHIMDLHGGEVSVQSELGIGSTFILRIPTVQH